MRIGIVTHDTSTLIRECPGPLPRGACPLTTSQDSAMPCAGQHVLLKLRVIGKPKTWQLNVSPGIHECPVYVLNGGFPAVL